MFTRSLIFLALVAQALAVPLKPRDTACSPLELVFARGTTEMQGLGIVGTPLASDLAKGVSGATSYAVVYPADEDFVGSPMQGATDAENHIKSRAAACPDMKFALAGYSQGAMVVHDVKLSSDLQAKVVAVAVFGDPYRTLNMAFPVPGGTSNVYSACATGDPVCENGMDVAAHLSYATTSVGPAASFIAQKFNGGSSTSTNSGSSSSASAASSSGSY